MKPETIKKLNDELPELRELRAFLAQKLAELNTVNGLKITNHNEIAIEALARIRAHEKLFEILSDLLPQDIHTPGTTPNSEYVV